MRTGFVLLSLLLALPAAAKPRVVVAPFTGPKSGAVRDQVIAELCQSVECVPTKGLLSGSKLDWKKVAKKRVAAVVSANVNAVGQKAAVYVYLLDPSDKSELAEKRRYPLKKFKLDRKELASLVSHVKGELSGGGGSREEPVASAEKEKGKGKGKSKPEPEPEGEESTFLDKDRARPGGTSKEPEEPPPDPEPEPVVTRKKEREPVAEATPPPSEPPQAPPEGSRDNPPPIRGGTPPEDPQAVVEPKPRAGPMFRGVEDIQLRGGGKSPTFVTVELGTDLYSRRFDYTQLSTANLRRYNASLIIAPTVGAQLYPFASAKSLIAGLGLEGSFSFSVGLSSRETKDAPPHPTSLTRLDVGLRFAVRPLKSSDLSISAQAGFRRSSFFVGAAEDGTTLDGMPGITYSALKFGLGLDVPLAERFTPFLRLSFMPVFSVGEIISPAYFQGGRVSGLELSLGTGVKIVDHWEARLAVQLTRYGIEFRTNPGDTFIASGAIDLYVGGTVALRYVF